MRTIRQLAFCVLIGVVVLGASGVRAQTIGYETVVFTNIESSGGVLGGTTNIMGTMTLDLGGGVKMDFVLIPPGTFMMGASNNVEEYPMHLVTLTNPFYIGKYLVTQEQWTKIMGANPSTPPICATNPANCTPWYDCGVFASNVSAQCGVTARRPTEAEWEYACRAGSTSEWFFGSSEFVGSTNVLAQYAWYASNSGGNMHPVGQLLPNPWGLYDMYGEVMEFCQDGCNGASDYTVAYNPNGSITNPVVGLMGDGHRELRGGAYLSAASSCDSVIRLGAGENPLNALGCRLLVEAPSNMVPIVSNGGGASNVAAVSAALNGNLVSIGTSTTTVSVCWGTVDHGTNTVGWDHVVNFGQCAVGPLTTNVTGLTEGATYYYRFCASNLFGRAWADPAAQFTTESQPAIDNGSGATNVTPTSARLMGNFTGGEVATVTVYWGTTDGGTTPSNWQYSNNFGILNEGAVFYDISGLNPSATYCYRFRAANVVGTVWANSTATFQAAPSPMDGSAGKMKIMFNGYNKTEALTNFPALVILNTNLANFSYGQFVSTNGYDLRFLDVTETTNLNYEIDTWVTNGNSCVWVQVPQIGTNTDYIWAYWGNPAVTSQQACTTNGSTWNSNFDAVWHMKESNALDSTSNRLNGTKAGNVTASPTGIVDGADNFAGGATDCIGVGQIMRTQFTYCGWIYPVGGVNNNIFVENINAATRDMYLNSGHLVLGWWNAVATTLSGGSISTGSWYYVAGTWDGTTRRIYINGIGVGSDTPVAPASGGWLWAGIGRAFPSGGWQGGLGNSFNGRMDEFRVLKVGLSSNWVWASYMTVASNSLFSSYQVQSGSTSGATVHGIPYSWLGGYGIANTNNSVETENPDGDRLNNLQEYIAGTDPTNPNSCFTVGITNTTGQILVRVPSVQATGANYNGKSRYYDVEMRTSLLSGSWQPVPDYTNIPGNGSAITCTNATQNPAAFYRAKVRLQ